MIPLDIHVGAAAGVPPYEIGRGIDAQRQAALPPFELGATVDLGPAPNGTSHWALAVDVIGWGGVYDVDLPFAHEVTSWQIDADLAAIVPGEREGKIQSFAMLGGGFRYARLSQSWWSDVAAYGIGGVCSFGVRIGEGDVRGLVAARADLSLMPGMASGSYGPDPTLQWSWTPTSARASVIAGISFR